MIDLHCHSHYSDGELSPNELLAQALHFKVHTLALTDHDTVRGLPLLHQAASNHAINIINGIELSAAWKKYDIHIIGLNINPNDQNLKAFIHTQSTRRISRARQIAERLINCGIAGNVYDKACELAGHEHLGRPHFAAVLINEGLVKDMKTAFQRFLGRGRPAYVATAWPGLEESVKIIQESGGQAVIAHPLKYGLTRLKLHALIKTFKEAGGKGIEVVSGDITVGQANEVAGFCDRYQLLASTGSDYHGPRASRVALGHQPPLPSQCIPIWHEWNL